MSQSSTTMAEEECLPNPHPGEILAEEFMRPMGVSQNRLARSIQIPPRRVNQIVHGRRAITADTDLRLARYFGLSERLFLGLQADYDLMETKRALGPPPRRHRAPRGVR